MEETIETLCVGIDLGGGLAIARDASSADWEKLSL